MADQVTTGENSVDTTRGTRRAPGPRGRFLLGVAPEFQRDPFRYLEWLARTFGDVVQIPFGLRKSHFLFHPDAVKRVLQDNYRNYPKLERTMDILRLGLLTGDSVFTAEGDRWLRQRRLMQPTFHRRRIAGFGATMTAATHEMLERWRSTPGSPLDVQREMFQLTLTIVGRALFSVDLTREARTLGQAFTTLLGYYTDRMQTPFAPPPWVPTRRNRAFHRAARLVDDGIRMLIAERRRATEEPGDLLSMLLSTRYEDTGEEMSDDQVIDETETLLAAGHETTANTLTWAFYLLSQHPAVEEQLQAELKRVLGGRTPVVEDIPALPYTRAVIDETLRLYPPAHILVRQLREADEVDGYMLPAGSALFLSPWVTQRDPRWWENPLAYRPARFGPDAASRPGMAYFPFGAGPRLCIGAGFALTEAVLVLATIAQHYRLRLEPNHRVEPYLHFTVRIRNGLPMRLAAIQS